MAEGAEAVFGIRLDFQTGNLAEEAAKVQGILNELGQERTGAQGRGESYDVAGRIKGSQQQILRQYQTSGAYGTEAGKAVYAMAKEMMTSALKEAQRGLRDGAKEAARVVPPATAAQRPGGGAVLVAGPQARQQQEQARRGAATSEQTAQAEARLREALTKKTLVMDRQTQTARTVIDAEIALRDALVKKATAIGRGTQVTATATDAEENVKRTAEKKVQQAAKEIAPPPGVGPVLPPGSTRVEVGGPAQPKRPTPEAIAQLPLHIQEKLKDPAFDIRKDPEGMSHLLAASMGGGFAKLAQNVAAAGQPSSAAEKIDAAAQKIEKATGAGPGGGYGGAAPAATPAEKRVISERRRRDEREAEAFQIPGFKELSGRDLKEQLKGYRKLEAAPGGEDPTGKTWEQVKMRLAILKVAADEAAESTARLTAAQKQLAQAERLGVEDAARLQKEQPERFQAIRRQYVRAAGEGIDTRNLSYEEVRRVHQQARYRDIGGDQGPPGFLHELLTASTLGIGGYRRFGHLAPGQLAGGALQALPTGLITGAAFTAFYSLQQGVTKAVSAATELQKSLVEVKDQANAIGQGDQFSSLRDSIMSVSEATGVAGTDVASLAQEFLGLYQNSTQAASATRDAAEFVAESGVSAATAGPLLGALAQNYQLTTRQSSNAAITASNLTGRRQGDILQAAADVAPVAAVQGFSANQMFGLITGALQGSALSGGQVGEGLARVLPEMQNSLSKLARDGVKFSPEAMRGNIPQALTQLITQFNNPTVNRQQVLADLGGPKEAGVIASLANNPQAIAELNKNYTDNTALANRFAAVQQTVGQSLARARAAATAFAESLLAGGLGQAFATIVGDAAGVIHVIADITGAFEHLNQLMGGIPGHLLEIGAALALLNRVGAFTAIGSLVEKLGRLGQMGVAQAAGLGTPLSGAAGRQAERLGGFFASPTVRRARAGEEEQTLRQRAGALIAGGGAGGAGKVAVEAEKQATADTARVVAERDLQAATELLIEAEARLAAVRAEDTAATAAASAEVVAARALKTEAQAGLAATEAGAGGNVLQRLLTGLRGGGAAAPAAAGAAEAGIVSGGAGSLGAAGIGGAGLAGFAGPQAIITGAVIADYVAASALSRRSSQAYNRRVGGEQTTVSNLSNQDLATLALTGSTKPVASKTSTLGYAANVPGFVLGGGLERTVERQTLGRIPVAGRYINDIFNAATPFAAPADILRHAPLIGHLFGSRSESARQIAQDEQRSRDLAQGINLGGFNPAGMTQATVQALEKAVSPNMGKSLDKALTDFENKSTAGNYAALRNLYDKATKPGTAGATAVEDAKAQAARQTQLSKFTDQAGSQFQSVSDITASFQSGLISASEALKDMTQVVNTDAQATVTEKQQRMADIAAMKQFQAQLATENIGQQQNIAQYLQGANPQQLFTGLQGQVVANAPALMNNPQQLVQYGQQLAQQASGVNDYTISTSNSLDQLQGLIQGKGTAGVSRQAADVINAADLQRQVAPEFPAVQAAEDRNKAIDAHNAQVRQDVRRAQIAARKGGEPLTQQDLAGLTREEGGIQANVKVPDPKASLLNYQQDIAVAQKVTQVVQINTGLAVAQAQANQQNASVVAAIQTKGDQDVLARLQKSQADITAAGGQSDLLAPQIKQAETQLAQDKVNQAAAAQTAIQQWGSYMKAANFQDPVAQAQIGLQQGQAEAAALGTTIPALAALAASGKGLTDQQAKALSDAQQGISDLFTATQSRIAALTSAAQAGLAFTPLAADVRGVQGAQQAIGAAGYNPQQLAGLVASGKATAQQSQLYQGYQNSINQQFTDQTAISVQALTNAGNLAQAQGNSVTAAVDNVRAINARLSALASRGANAQNSQEFAQLLGERNTANINIAQAQFQVSQAQFQTAEAVATGSGNPVQAAQKSLQAAQAALAYWKSLGALPGVSQQLQEAQTAVVTQQAAVFNAQQQQAASVAQVRESQIAITGNTPAVAQAQLQEAERALAAFKAKYPSQANLGNKQFADLTVAANNAKANFLETTISFNETQIQELVATNKISVGQAIGRLKGLQAKAAAAGNQAEVLRIQAEIQQYINQGNENASFNLPSNLNLPTLYEVRRTEATPRGGNYYGQSGPVNVNINIDNQVDVQSAVNKLTQAVGGPPTTGYSLPY